MQTNLREIFAEIRYFSTSKKFGIGLFALVDLSLISRMTFDLTAANNAGLPRQLCETEGSPTCVVPMTQFPLHLLVFIVLNIIFFFIIKKWAEQLLEEDSTLSKMAKVEADSKVPDTLLKWAELLEKGLITKDDFEKKRKELLED
jgi:Short C-terminal domain